MFSIFGLMLILTELRVHLIVDLFSFLDGFCGKGMFLILYSFYLVKIISCGTLMIDSFSGDSVHESIVGNYLIKEKYDHRDSHYCLRFYHNFIRLLRRTYCFISSIYLITTTNLMNIITINMSFKYS
jgi:hypothetical protein